MPDLPQDLARLFTSPQRVRQTGRGVEFLDDAGTWQRLNQPSVMQSEQITRNRRGRRRARIVKVFRTYWCFAIQFVQRDPVTDPGFDFGFFDRFVGEGGVASVSSASCISFPSNPDIVPVTDFVQTLDGIQIYNEIPQSSVTLRFQTNRLFYEGLGATAFFMTYCNQPFTCNITINGNFKQSLGAGIYLTMLGGMVNPDYFEPPLPPYPEPPPNLYNRSKWVANDWLTPPWDIEVERTLEPLTFNETRSFPVNVPVNAFLTTITNKVFLNPDDYRPYDNEESYWEIAFNYT